MSDLISRSELIKHFEAIQSQECAIGLDFVAMIDVIKEQPTAYSVDKVVDELEEKARTVNVIGYGTIYEAINKDVAIEIVKQGDVNDDVADDVCEWKSVSDGEFIQNPHTKRLYSNEQSMKNVYCNTCGKKIKVAE